MGLSSFTSGWKSQMLSPADQYQVHFNLISKNFFDFGYFKHKYRSTLILITDDRKCFSGQKWGLKYSCFMNDKNEIIGEPTLYICDVRMGSPGPIFHISDKMEGGGKATNHGRYVLRAVPCAKRLNVIHSWWCRSKQSIRLNHFSS